MTKPLGVTFDFL